MYILKNALKNLRRNKGRNILIGVIVLTMISSIAISIIINTTTNGVIESYKEKFGSEVFINYKLEKLRSYFEEDPNRLAPTPTAEQYEKFSKSDKLKEVKFKINGLLFTDGFKAVGQDAFNEAQNKRRASSNLNNALLQGVATESNSNGVNPAAESFQNITLTGYSSNNLPDEFTKTKMRNIVDGNMFNDNNEAIISSELAKLNNLKVGDEIKLNNGKDTEGLILKICGIYEDLTNNNLSKDMPTSMNPRNEIITSYTTASNYNNLLKNNSTFNIEATMFLKSPNLIDSFKDELKSMGLSDDFDVTTDEAAYEKIVGPVNGLKRISVIFMISIMIFGSIVLILLSILSIRERKYEIGVLRAMGMTKWKLARGFIYESLLIISICLVVGLGIGSTGAKPISNILINNQVAISQQSNNIYEGIDDSLQENEIDALEKLDVKLTVQSALEITMFAIALGLITSSISVFYATKYEPIKILSERN